MDFDHSSALCSLVTDEYYFFIAKISIISSNILLGRLILMIQLK